MEQLSPELFLVAGNTDSFVVDDLLDFSNDDGQVDDGCFDTFPDSPPFSAGNLADISNSSTVYNDGAGFSDHLCVPCEHIAELEWLSNFVEESFTKEDQDKLQLLSGLKNPQQTGLTQTKPEPDRFIITTDTDTNESNASAFPAKSRSKRSRSPASTWTSRLLTIAAGESSAKKKKQSLVIGEIDNEIGGGFRRCLHCATEKTPQWRTGPMGPKTLCNACGVRFKSGRLVPEYRPASSPTFVTASHSNSHRKVMELRRQKEMREERLFRSNGEDFSIRDSNNNNNNSHVASNCSYLV
ncbi:unnamed protein product [Cochlearia groenlandica]